MAAVFPSEEWIEEVGRASQRDTELRGLIKGFEGSFVFHVEPEEGLLEKTFYLYFKLDQNGVHSGAALSFLDERPNVDYVIAGRYSNWKAVLKGDIDPLKALMTRKLWLARGKMMNLLKSQKMALRLISLCAEMKAVFVDEMAAELRSIPRGRGGRTDG
jgi:putative sterol carrier protein